MGKALDGKDLGKGISQRADGLYMARCMVNGRSETIYNRSLTQLRRDLTDLRSQMQHGIYLKEDKTRLCDWYEEWLKTYGGKRRQTGCECHHRGYH